MRAGREWRIAKALTFAMVAGCSNVLGADFDATRSADAGHDPADAKGDAHAPGQAIWLAGLKGKITLAGAGALLVDPQGAIYVAGVVTPPADFGCPQGEIAGGSANGHAFIAKYGADGDCIWARLFDSGYGNRIALGSDGQPWLVGYFTPSLEIGEQLGTLSTVGGNDSFAIKLDAATGKPLAARQFGTPVNDEARTLLVHSSGDLVIAGATTGAGVNDAFVARYAEDGEQRWVRQWGSNAEDLLTSMAWAQEDNLLVAGTIGGTISGDIELPAAGSAMFVAEFSAAGEFRWAQTVNDFGAEFGYSLATANGRLHVAGFGTSPSLDDDVVLAELNANDPSQAAAAQHHGVPGSNEVAYGLALDPADGSRFLGGKFDGDTTFGATSLLNAGAWDAFVLALDQSGTALWARGFGSAGKDVANAVAVAPDGSLVVLGTFQGTTLTIDGLTVTGGGTQSFFVAKLRR